MIKSKHISILLAVMLMLPSFSVLTVMAADPPVITRTINPDVVLPGDEVTVEISFTATENMGTLAIDDSVPTGWNVDNGSLSSSPAATNQRFKDGTVGFFWMSQINTGTTVTVSYTLQVPGDATAGDYSLSGYSIANYPGDGEMWNVIITGEDTVTVDTSAPYTDEHNPAQDSTGVPIDSDIVVHVKDDGAGVDQTTIAMTVEGTDVTSDLTISGGSSDYTLTYNPPINFSYEQVVNVVIGASDLAGNTMTADAYIFTTESEIVEGSISGKIGYSYSSNGIPDVVVNLTQGGSIIDSTTTDGNGDYSFSNVVVGEYDVDASKDGFWDNSTTTTVNSGEVSTVDIMLWLKGDLNNNGIIDIGDVSKVANMVVGNVPEDLKADFNGNGMADIGDAAKIANYFVGNVPEL
ncbi:MAG: carboxypeptidase regulatory-like domain-containing protein [Halobacteriota archaeon]|nr:carboxypeptidase regulatory-like domain-containing protein [Halobacteriota archaeon]